MDTTDLASSIHLLSSYGRIMIPTTDEEQFELTADGRLPISPARPRYKDGSTIDWLNEDAAERERQHLLRSAHGVRGLLLPILDGARMSFVVVATGLGIGIAGAWLDVLVKWLDVLYLGIILVVNSSLG